MEPIIHFPWVGDEGSKEVLLYMLAEEALADSHRRVELCVSVQNAAAMAHSLSAFEEVITALAEKEDLESTFYATPDHSDPLGQRISVGLKPRTPSEPVEPLFAFGR